MHAGTERDPLLRRLRVAADMINEPPTTPRMATQAVSFIGAISVIAAGVVFLAPR
jgi:hypothetical protein